MEQPVKIILSIREEYLGHLYEFEREVPQLLRKKLRVEPMHLDKVKSVITQVGALPQGNIRLQAGEEAAISTGIFDKIKGKEKTLAIELPYLQVFLDKLYLQTTGDDSRQADALFTRAALKKMGDIGDVLRDFLDEQVLLTAQKLEQQPETIWRILSPFVTLEGTKEPLSEPELCERLPDIKPALIAAALDAFSKSRILRYTEQEQRYEIKHDSLAKQIHAKRSDEEIAILEVQRLIKSQSVLKPEAREFFTEKQLLFIEPFLAKCALTAEEQDWIAQSREQVEAEKIAKAHREAEELENARQQAEQEKKLREQAEQARSEADAQRLIAQQNEKQAKTNEKRARQRTRVAALATVVALALALFAWKSYAGAEQNAEKARTALEQFILEKNARSHMEFNNLEARVNTIFRVGGCPSELLTQMDTLAVNLPDSLEFKKKLRDLRNANPTCK